MHPKFGLLLICLVFAAAFSFLLPSGAAGQAAPADNPFAGKIVTVYLKGEAIANGQILEKAEIKEVGGRTMIVGVGVDTGEKENWTAGVGVGVAWDSVAMYYIMTKEQFEERAKKHGP